MSWTETITSLGKRALCAGPVELGATAVLAASWDAERPIYYVGQATLSALGYLYAVSEDDRRLRGVSGSVVVRDLDTAREPAMLLSAALSIASMTRGRLLVGLSSGASPLGAQLVEGGLFRADPALDLGRAEGEGMVLWYEVSRGHFSAPLLGRSRRDVVGRLGARVRAMRATTLERLVYGGGEGFTVQLCDLQRACVFCGAGPAVCLLKRRKQAPAPCCQPCGRRRDPERTRELYGEEVGPWAPR